MCGTLFRCTGLLVHTRRVCATPCPGISFFLHRAIGAPEPRRRFTLSGRQFFQHRLSGVRELRQRVRPDGRLLSLHRLSGAHELPQAGSPLTGGVFSAEPQRGGFAVCGRRERRGARRGDDAVPTAGAKRKDNLRFSFLFELLPFPCFLIWRRLPTCDRSEIRYGRGFFSSVFFSTYSQGQIPYFYTYRQLYAGCGITVPHNSIARYDRQHLRR